MPKLAIALDLGTSGFRGQAIDLDEKGRIITTAITTRHPLPGANVIDHLHFALEVGIHVAHMVIVSAVNHVIDALEIEKDQVIRMAVCGNPIQLSLFQEIEIRDLAYAGKQKLESIGVIPPVRDAQIVKASHIEGLDLAPDIDILIPPAVQHEIGADALAMMIQTGMLEKEEIAIVTDYGTNAEMALVAKGIVYTGSTAAGPALEGQQIEHGLLALPGAISDVEFVPDESRTRPASAAIDKPMDGRLKTRILNTDMSARTGDTVNPNSGEVLEKGELAAVGITGTGVVGLISQGLISKLIRIPRIRTFDSEIHLPDGIRFTENDLAEAGKAIGSVRAGHITLCKEAGLGMEDIETAYMSGASGTYVDALKAREVGLIPAGVRKIYQVGNTSLAMARDIVLDVDNLWKMKAIADDLKKHHCMFAASKVFEKVFILELSYWTEGMPLAQYQRFLAKYGMPALTEVESLPEVIKMVDRDIPELGYKGLRIIPDIGEQKVFAFEACIGDEACVSVCPERALTMKSVDDQFQVTVDLALCDGVACRRCERACTEKCFDLVKLFTANAKRPGWDPEDIDRTMLPALKRVPGLKSVWILSAEDFKSVFQKEQEAEERSLLGLGKVVNTGVKKVLASQRVYVALTTMAFDWGCHATLVLKKGDEMVGEQVRDETRLAELSTRKDVWFMHKNFVIYKNKINFPRDIVKKVCHFEIPCLPAGFCIPENDRMKHYSIVFATPSMLGDIFLKNRYCAGVDEKGTGTILVGVQLL
ncbi:MAG: methylamine methyltransferase corrinoid protein reductive activase [Desulfobacteraceae bacterium]|nr:methylamine methyltransferase corrinoid protein reductive activase [Desulfobacteraceae bacterium]